MQGHMTEVEKQRSSKVEELQGRLVTIAGLRADIFSALRMNDQGMIVGGLSPEEQAKLVELDREAERVSHTIALALTDSWTDYGHLGPRSHGLWRRIDPGLPSGDAVEVALEAGRGADDQHPCLCAAQVGEGMGDVAGSEGQLSLFPREDLVLELEGKLAFEDVEGLVEAVVVQRRSLRAGGDAVVHHGDLPPALLAAQKDVDPSTLG
jgi:hypothetical protein